MGISWKSRDVLRVEFRKHLEFAQKGYGSGDQVCAKLEVKSADGCPSVTLNASAQMNGNEFFSSTPELDDGGNAVINFTMPEELAETSAILNISIDDGSVTESISKTIPILKNNIEVNFYPEGGSIIEGLVNFVYVESFMNSQDPADIDAVIYERRPSGEEVPIQRFHTEHEGRCKFSFTPKENHVYRCGIIRPDVGDYEPKLPEILENGVVLHASKEIYEADEDISICVGSTNACILLAQVFRKENLVYQEELHFSEETVRETQNYLSTTTASPVSLFGNVLHSKETSNVSDIDLSLYGGGTLPVDFLEDSLNSPSPGAYHTEEEEPEDENPILSHPAMKFVSFNRNSRTSDNDIYTSGVFRVTVSDKKSKTPFCERIVYRKCSETLQVRVVTDKEKYTEEDQPMLAVKVMRQDGTPVPNAVVSVCVVDDSILQMQEKRLQHPHLPAMVLLESDVKELRDAGVYLPEFADPSIPFSPRMLDLLLGVQGWRKFVFSFQTKKQQDEFFEKYPAVAPALLSRSVISNSPGDAPPLPSAASYYDSDSSDEFDDFESLSLVEKCKRPARRKGRGGSLLGMKFGAAPSPPGCGAPPPLGMEFEANAPIPPPGMFSASVQAPARRTRQSMIQGFSDNSQKLMGN